MHVPNESHQKADPDRNKVDEQNTKDMHPVTVAFGRAWAWLHAGAPLVQDGHYQMRTKVVCTARGKSSSTSDAPTYAVSPIRELVVDRAAPVRRPEFDEPRGPGYERRGSRPVSMVFDEDIDCTRVTATAITTAAWKKSQARACQNSAEIVHFRTAKFIAVFGEHQKSKESDITKLQCPQPAASYFAAQT
jgi:hypothetical protein